MSNPQNSSSPDSIRRQSTDPSPRQSNSQPARADQLSKRIEQLAAEMAASPKRKRLDDQTLAQLDELSRLLSEQQRDLQQHAADASETLKDCSEELAKNVDLHQTLELFRAQQRADRARDARQRAERRKRAA